MCGFCAPDDDLPDPWEQADMLHDQMQEEAMDDDV